MTTAWQHLVGAVKLLADGADWWAFYTVEQHAVGCIANLCGRAWPFSFLQGCFPEWVTYVFPDNAFLDDKFLVFCILCSTLCVDWRFAAFFNLGPSLCWTCMRAFTASRSGELVCWRPWLAGVKSIWWISRGRVFHPCCPEDGWMGMGVGVNVDIMAILIFRKALPAEHPKRKKISSITLSVANQNAAAVIIYLATSMANKGHVTPGGVRAFAFYYSLILIYPFQFL